MKKVTYLKRFFLLTMAIGLVSTFTSCGDDEKTDIPVYSLKDVDGGYAGKMATIVVAPQTYSNIAPQGVDVAALVRNDSVIIEKLPVDDLIKTIINDETEAEAIIKSIGNVNYKVFYKAAFNERKDSIYLEMKPEPLEISFEIPASEEGAEATQVTVKATISSTTQGSFAYKNRNLKFVLNITEIKMNDAAIEFPAFRFAFSLNKK